MDRRFWDQIAPSFKDDVFDVVGLDQQHRVVRHIRSLASAKHDAIDFGCGIGRHLPLLADSFASVCAVDISEECLHVARQACRGFEAVEYLAADLADEDLPLPQAHFGLCINVLIMPSHEIRTAILATMSRHLRAGGHLLVVVPSLESVLYAHRRLIQWNRREGGSAAEAWAENEAYLGEPDGGLAAGIVCLNGTRTKHYLREELEALFGRVALRVQAIEKVTYPWSTEFTAPPAWMKAPYPWDWLIVLKK